MAVDFAVPLINNIKCAKLLVEALVRKSSLEVSSVDYKTSHETHVFPGLVSVSTFSPGFIAAGNDGFENVTKAALSAGFTTAMILPFSKDGDISDKTSLDVVQVAAEGAAYCNYAFSVVASPSNVQELDEELQSETKALYIPFSRDISPKSMVQQVAGVAAHFASWPNDKPIITDAKGSDLASVLLLASLHGRPVHVTDVRSREDLLLISLSKAKELKVTCDVSVYALFFAREDFDGASCLPSKEDQARFWKHLDVIDGLEPLTDILLSAC